MKTTIALIILVIVAFACHRKTVAGSDEIIISNKTNKTSTSSSSSEATSAGQTIYTNRCGRCHSLKKTENYTAQKWENILKSMIPKARLNDEEAKQVTAYVMTNAKK